MAFRESDRSRVRAGLGGAGEWTARQRSDAGVVLELDTDPSDHDPHATVAERLVSTPAFQRWYAELDSPDSEHDEAERLHKALAKAWWIGAGYSCPMYSKVADRFDADASGFGSDHDYDSDLLGNRLYEAGYLDEETEPIDWVETNGSLIEAWADAQYAATQDRLVLEGRETITVYRGLSEPDDVDDTSLPEGDDDLMCDPASAPLTSWSTSFDTAERYSHEGDGNGGAGIVIRMYVPARDIFAIPDTDDDIGSVMQSEVVVIARSRHSAEITVDSRSH